MKILLLLFAFSVSVLSATENPKQVFTIGIKATPPFTIKNEDGTWSGPTVWLIKRIVQDMGMESSFEELELSAIFDNLKSGEIDAGIAALSITADREEIIDFTHSYFESGIGIATAREDSEMWLLAIRNLVSLRFLQLLGSLLLLLGVVGLLMWLAERKVNHEQFGGKPGKGIGSGLWWSAVTMTTVGYGDKAPKTPLGRAIGLVWMFLAIVIISGFTAGFASSLTRDSISMKVQNVRDLANVRTATVAGSTSAAWLAQLRIPFQTSQDLNVLLHELDQGKWGAVVFDKPVLEYIVAKDNLKGVEILGPVYSRENYGIALPQSSPYLERMNILLLELTETTTWSEQLYAVFQK